MTTEYRTSRLIGVRSYRSTSLADSFKIALIQIGLFCSLACGRGTLGWGDSDSSSTCKDDLPERHTRCAPADNGGLETLGRNCARDLSDEGLELEVDEECSWVVCIDANEIDGSCDSEESEDLARIDQLIESRFEILNSESHNDFGFSVPFIFGAHCRAQEPIEERCCYVVPVKEYCHHIDDAVD